MSNVRSGSEWRRVREQVLREESTCHLCKQPVDKTIPYRDRRTGAINGDSASVHHLDPHPTPDNVARRARLRLTHRRCNLAFGDGTKVKPRTSRRW